MSESKSFLKILFFTFLLLLSPQLAQASLIEDSGTIKRLTIFYSSPHIIPFFPESKENIETKPKIVVEDPKKTKEIVSILNKSENLKKKPYGFGSRLWFKIIIEYRYRKKEEVFINHSGWIYYKHLAGTIPRDYLDQLYEIALVEYKVENKKNSGDRRKEKN